MAPFEPRCGLLQRRLDDLAALILDQPAQRKRVIRVQEIVLQWLNTVALPAMKSQTVENRRRDRGRDDGPVSKPPVALGNSLLDQAREILQSLQDEEQIALNQRMVEQEWATSVHPDSGLSSETRALGSRDGKGEARISAYRATPALRKPTSAPSTDFYTYHGYLSILVANNPSQAELLAEIRANVELWINASAVPEIEAKRIGKDQARPPPGGQWRSI